jgi:hypothetical protein
VAVPRQATRPAGRRDGQRVHRPLAGRDVPGLLSAVHGVDVPVVTPTTPPVVEPLTGAEAEQLRNLILRVARLRPCHVTGMHEPDHHLRYTCGLQVQDIFAEVLAAANMKVEDFPHALHPEPEYWCHGVPGQEKYREQHRRTYAWAGLPVPDALVPEGSPR